MTRINCIPVEELTREHLLAEYRELPRVFALARGWYQKVCAAGHDGAYAEVPDTYRLGKGHVLFFYTRLGYCLNRQRRLYEECLRRGYRVKFEPSEELISWAPPFMRNEWTPTAAAQKINRARIKERLDARGHKG